MNGDADDTFGHQAPVGFTDPHGVDVWLLVVKCNKVASHEHMVRS